MMKKGIIVCMTAMAFAVHTFSCNLFDSVVSAASEDDFGSEPQWYYISSTYKKGIAIRNEPSKDAELLTRIPYGTEFYVEMYNGSWGYTTVDGVTGWILLDYAEVVQEDVLSDIAMDEEIYGQVIQQYQDAISYYRATGEYLSKDFFLTKEFLVTNDSGIEPWYGFYDIDGNGIDELFIGYETIDGIEWKIVDVYTCRDTGIWRLGDQGAFSETSGSHIYKDGTIYLNSQYASVFCRIAEDGYTLGVEDSYLCETTYIDRHTEPIKTYYNDQETLTQDELQEKIDALGDEIEVDWKKIDLQADTIPNEADDTKYVSTTGIDAYDDILNRYYKGLTAGWSIQEFNDNGLCYLAGYNPDLDQTGYCLLDIDQNGTEELIVGMNVEGYDGIVYEIYTILNGELVRVLSSGERDRYYLCQDNIIANEGSSSALCSSWSYYDMIEGQLLLREAIFTDGYYDGNNPWFYTMDQPYEDYSNPLSEEEARSIIAGYEYREISFIPLSLK